MREDGKKVTQRGEGEFPNFYFTPQNKQKPPVYDFKKGL